MLVRFTSSVAVGEDIASKVGDWVIPETCIVGVKLASWLEHPIMVVIHTVMIKIFFRDPSIFSMGTPLHIFNPGEYYYSHQINPLQYCIFFVKPSDDRILRPGDQAWKQWRCKEIIDLVDCCIMN